MTDLLRHPVLPFVLAAILVPTVGGTGRRLLSLAAPLASLALLLSLDDGAWTSVAVIGHELILLRLDGLAYVFALAFILYAFVAAVYAWEDGEPGPKAAALGLCGAGVGVVLAGDLVSLFVFWEWLTVTSLFIIWSGGAPAWAAGLRYLLFHLLGAVMLLAGIVLRMADGETAFTAIALDQWSSWLILAGMLCNAAVPPLHAWLPDAYPRASVFGTVFLAAFTTKAAVYALARGFAGVELLVWVGTLMALVGVVYAVLENDIRRLLAYHVISQVGYMVAGVGLGTALAVNGTAAHAFSHVFYKGLLLMAAGAVIHATGRGKLTELGCLRGPLPWVLALMMIGAFSISGVPFFNGFVSKSMVVSAAASSDRGIVELLLLVASMGTFLHTGLKLPWFTFFGTDQGARVVRPVPPTMYAAMALAAGVCVVTGLFPAATLYAVLPFDAAYDPFTGHHFVEALQLLAGTALGFWLLRAKLGGEPTTTRDVDVVYRQPLALTLAGAVAAADGVGRRVRRLTAAAADGTWAALQAGAARASATPFAVQSAVTISAIAGGAWFFVWLMR